VTITTSAAMRDNAIYSAMFSCGQERVWQVGAKRSAGDTTFFLFNFQSKK
jgi:hypothetical protein